ncbi:FtsX-like permease family protein [Paractinoplanes maris]|uniref:FtsX-like permease family protein n=1 Tax=Paractinoplanes maris TaxID=1734446 RepID=UPI00201FD1A9|nr:FtsX-like permease family protein [Actinoplanes maris]
MLRLVYSDLLESVRVWLGIVVVSAAAAMVGAVVATTVETGVAAGGNTALALYAISGTMTVLSLASGFVVLSSVSGLVTTLKQRDYAVWQLAGLRARQIRAVVYAQLATLALIGSVAGLVLAVPLAGPVFRYGFGASEGLAEVEPRFGPVSGAAVTVFVVALVVTGSRRGVRSAGRVPIIQTLREADVAVATMTWRRWVLGAATLAVLATVGASLRGRAPEQVGAPLMLFSPLLALALVALAPAFMARLIDGWTRALPESRSTGWYLARNATTSASGLSIPAINPLMVSIALAGGLYAAAGAGGGSGSVTAGTVVLLLGGPVLLALLGAAATIFMSSRTREREVALVVATGGTRATVVAAAVAEAVIYVGTALLLGSAVVAATLVVGGWATGQGAAALLTTGAPAAVASVAALGAILIVPATVIPALAALRNDVPQVLAAE